MGQDKTSRSLIPLAEAARFSPYSADYLNLLVRRGKLPAKKIGRNWYTSEAALRWYLRRRNLADAIRHSSELTSNHPITSRSYQVHPIMIDRHHPALTTTTALRWLLIAISIFLLLLLVFPDLVFGMSSPNYRINQSFVGSGGTRESSASYRLIETLGDVGTGVSQSGNYRLRAGYLSGTQDPTLVFSISTTSLDLGTITPSAVSSNSHTMTVATDLTRGYVITAQADGPFRSGANTIPFVADGTVTAGSAEYGATFSGGLGSHPAGDISLASLTTVTSYNDNVSGGDTTTAIYKASAGPATQSGTYSSTTTYVATATF